MQEAIGIDALGLIETIGLTVAITAADAAVKAANVRIIDYELTRGKGLVTVKITGDVAAVKAALDAAIAASERIGTVYSKLVIPRPNEQLENLIQKTKKKKEKQTEQKKKSDVNEKTPEKPSADTVQLIDSEEETIALEETTGPPSVKIIEVKKGTEQNEENQEEKASLQAVDEIETKEDMCNLCKDPACPRRKGDLRFRCIHYKQEEE